MSKHSFEFLRSDISARREEEEEEEKREEGGLIQIHRVSTLPIARLVRATCRHRLRRIAGDEACSTRVTLRESYANVEIHAGSPPVRFVTPTTATAADRLYARDS